jgi:hypothetical protein
MQTNYKSPARMTKLTYEVLNSRIKIWSGGQEPNKKSKTSLDLYIIFNFEICNLFGSWFLKFVI